MLFKRNINDELQLISVCRIEKAEIVQLEPHSSKASLNASEEAIANNTKDILDKIAEIHRKQGLVNNKPKKHSPAFQFGFPIKNQRRYEQFQFPQTPFSNPIIDYLHSTSANKHTSFKVNEEQDNPDDASNGQVIRRKVTHQQSFSIIPMGQGPPFMPQPPLPTVDNQRKPDGKNNTKEMINATLESTIDNIKEIVNSQTPVPSSAPLLAYNPYSPVIPNPYFNPYYGYYVPYQEPERFSGDEPARRQIQWPWAQFFPIIIKDPIMQMFNAMTSMVEYGPTATCPGKEAVVQETKEIRQSKLLDSKENATLDIEDVKITESEGNPVVFTLNFKTPVMEVENERKEKATKSETKRVSLKKSENVQSPPMRDPELVDEDLDSEAEGIVLDSSIKKDDGIFHNHNKKFLSKDNTGSGIFIHKIKVRKGGVAIAGPGGIATAGSGGTAIVGPNGFAYTHPDSLAIAGTGSKVIAVDPSVSLSDVVNKTRKDGSVPRQGKVVAVGPVIYYNRG